MNFFVVSHLFILLINGIPFNSSSYEFPPSKEQEHDYLSFIVIGDWGEPKNVDNEIKNAIAMNEVARSSHTSFIVAVGDNFYHAGVTGPTDPKFQEVWESVYTGSEIQSLPWYVVMGNHDWYVYCNSISSIGMVIKMD